MNDIMGQTNLMHTVLYRVIGIHGAWQLQNEENKQLETVRHRRKISRATIVVVPWMI
jgi:uncharacterized membrane protein YuzA (DUF378 family)